MKAAKTGRSKPVVSIRSKKEKRKVGADEGEADEGSHHEKRHKKHKKSKKDR